MLITNSELIKKHSFFYLKCLLKTSELFSLSFNSTGISETETMLITWEALFSKGKEVELKN